MKIMKDLLHGDNPITDYLPKIEKKDLPAILWLISNLTTGFLKHRHDSNCLSIDKELKCSLFGKTRWYEKIYKNKCHPFNKLFIERIQGNNYTNATNGYEPTELLISAYLKWCSKRNNSTYDIIEINSKVIKSKNIILNDDIEERSNFYEEVEINISPIKDYFYELVESENITKDILLNKILPLKSFYDYIVENDNRLKIHYKISPAGRYYSVGRYSIQSLKKEVRAVILNGYKSYDISVSAPLLLSQIYSNIKKEKVPESISLFIKNKEKIREIFSEKYNIKIEVSKEFFTSLFFGSVLIPNDFKYHSSITKSLGIENINYILSDESSYEYKLYRDVKEVFRVISEHYKKINKEKVVLFNNIIFNVANKWKGRSVVSNLYQSLESVVLDSMINFYTSTTRDFNFVRVHDCLYTKKEINESDLYWFIKEKTDINVLFKKPITKQYEDKRLYEMFKMK